MIGFPPGTLAGTPIRSFPRLLTCGALAVAVLVTACGGGGRTVAADGGDAGSLGDAAPGTLALIVNVIPGGPATGADGSMAHPFPTLYDAVGAISTNTAWTGTLVVHQGRHELPTAIIISKRARLEALPGAQFFLGANASIHAQADVNIHGTAENPVLFTWLVPGTHWRSFTNFEPTSQNNSFEYAIFEHGGEAEFNGSSMRGALSLKQAGGRIANCEFRYNEGDDGINIRASNSVIENNYFHDNFNDALDSDTAAPNEGFVEVRFNRFIANANDGVDLGEGSTAYIHDNLMVGNGDKGISIGESSSPRIENNLIVGCYTGIGIKDMSEPVISNNTLYGNNIGVAVYQGVTGRGSGKGIFSNGIIWSSVAADVVIVNVNNDLSQTSFTYSCIQSGNYRVDLTGAGDPVPLSGTGLLSEASGCPDPMFAAPGAIKNPVSGMGQAYDPGDFHLKSPAGRFDPVSRTYLTTDTETSPAIDKGDPAAPFAKEPGPNGGRVDLGAYGNSPEASKSAE